MHADFQLICDIYIYIFVLNIHTMYSVSHFEIDIKEFI